MSPPLTAAEEDQRKAREAKQQMERALGMGASGDAPAFPLKKLIADQFTIKGTQETDWLKIGIAGFGAVIASIFAADTGILGMLIAGSAGAVVAGGAGIFLLGWLRGDSKDTQAPAPPPLYRPGEPKENKRVITQSQSVFPAVSQFKAEELAVTIPTYDKTQTPPAKATQEEIEKWRKIVALGSSDSRVAVDATNFYSRKMLEQLEREANSNEINLRYLRDEFPTQLEAPGKAVDNYFSKFGEAAQKGLSIQLDPILASKGVTMAEIPGRYGTLTDELEEYGKLIKQKLLTEMAELRKGRPADNELDESQKMFDKAWASLNVIGKRNLIANFSTKAIYDTMRNPTEWKDFFPEENLKLSRLLGDNGVTQKARDWAGINLNNATTSTYINLNTFSRPFASVGARDYTPVEQYVHAYDANDLEAMANILQQRLERDESGLGAANKLTDEARFRMKTFVMGFRAHGKRVELDKYIQDEVIGKQIPALEKFENALLAHSWKVDRVRKRIEAFEKGGKQFLIIDEASVDTKQTFTVLDTRDDQKKTFTVEITYEQKPEAEQASVIKSLRVKEGAKEFEDKTAALKSKFMPEGDISRFLQLQEILETPEVLKVTNLSPSLLELGERERGSTLLTYSDEAEPTPSAWTPSVNIDLAGRKV